MTLKCYKVFVNKGIIAFNILFTLGMLAFPIVMNKVFDYNSTVGIVMVTILSIIALLMTDFFCFGGIAVKKQKIMEYCRSSVVGVDVVKNGLTGDAVFIFVKMLIVAGLSVIISAVIDGAEIGIFLILYAVSLPCTAVIIIFLSLLFTRKFCRTMTTHMLISYLVTSVSSLLFIPVLMIFSNPEGFLQGVIYTAIAILVSIALGIALVVEGVNGYKSGFYDK